VVINIVWLTRGGKHLHHVGEQKYDGEKPSDHKDTDDYPTSRRVVVNPQGWRFSITHGVRVSSAESLRRGAGNARTYTTITTIIKDAGAQKWAHRHSLNRTWYALTGGHMADIQRISVQQAHAKTKSNQALLVCAYEDEAKCRMLNLDGSISFTSLQSRAASLPKTQEIIFY